MNDILRRSLWTIALFAAIPSRGLALPGPVPDQPSFGTTDRFLLPILHIEFSPSDSSLPWQLSPGLTSPLSPVAFVAPLKLPSGALLTYLELDYVDNDAANDVSLFLFDCSFLLAGCQTVGQLSSDTGFGGTNYVSVDLTPLGHTVNNNSRRLFLQAVTKGLATQVVGAYIGFKLQVSPAPASATFADVPTSHPYFRFVEALYRAGITGGCGGNNYCVNSPITRGEMAVFLAAALGLHFPN